MRLWLNHVCIFSIRQAAVCCVPEMTKRQQVVVISMIVAAFALPLVVYAVVAVLEVAGR